MIENILATIATILVVGSYIPQMIKGYRTKSMRDISMVFLVIVGAGVLCWIAYGILKKDPIFIAANVITAGCCVTLITMKIYYDKRYPAQHQSSTK